MRRITIMMSILEAIANDNMNLSQEALKKDFNKNHYKNVIKIMDSSKEKLLNRLDDKNKESFERFLELQEEAAYFANMNKFVYGYRVGVKMMVDVLISEESFV